MAIQGDIAGHQMQGTAVEILADSSFRSASNSMERDDAPFFTGFYFGLARDSSGNVLSSISSVSLRHGLFDVPPSVKMGRNTGEREASPSVHGDTSDATSP